MAKKTTTPRNNPLDLVESLYSKWWFILITTPTALIISYLLVRAAGVPEGGNLTMDGEPYGAAMATITFTAVVLNFFFGGVWRLVSVSQAAMIIGSLFYLVVRSAGIDLGAEFVKPLDVIGGAACALGILAWIFGSRGDW
jgi:hypothetical protein